MKLSKIFILTAALLLIMLLFVNGSSGVEVVEVVEEQKKACKYKSEKFWGICISDLRCNEVCRREGFETGDCKGIRRRCYCVNRCN